MLVTIISFVVVLGILITVHEFGHFAVAKLLKIRVLTFSVGFGPRLIGFHHGGTDYRISAVPLGGFVKMAGETYDEDRQGTAEEFLSHPKWHRFLVALAGPFMNIFLAVAVMAATYMGGVRVFQYLREPAIVGPVAEDSIAQKAGLRSGDRIVGVRGNAVETWEDMEIALGTAPKNALEVEVSREGRRIPIRLDSPGKSAVDPMALGFRFNIPKTVVSEVNPKSPADKAGLRIKDQILSVQGGGKTGRRYDEILNIISASKGIPLAIEIVREEQKLSLTITPVEEDGRVVIGFYPEVPSVLEKYGLFQAIGHSIERNFEMSALIFKTIGRIFTGSASVKMLSGPIEIARISGSAARTGSARVFIGFIGLISLNLGIMNLLPIPILDGGVITLLLIEGIIRRDLSLALKEKIVQVGFVFLILLMGFVVFNDLSKIVSFEKLFR